MIDFHLIFLESTLGSPTWRIKTNASQMAKWSNFVVNDCRTKQRADITDTMQSGRWLTINRWLTISQSGSGTNNTRRRTAGQKSRKPICTLWHWKPPLTFWATLAHLFPLAAQCVSTIQDSQSLGPSACWWLPTSWCLPSCYLTHPWKTRLPDSWEAHCSQWWWPQTHRPTQDSWKPIVMIPIYVITWPCDHIIPNMSSLDGRGVSSLASPLSGPKRDQRTATDLSRRPTIKDNQKLVFKSVFCFWGELRGCSSNHLLELFLKFNGKDHLSMDIGHIP